MQPIDKIRLSHYIKGKDEAYFEVALKNFLRLFPYSGVQPSKVIGITEAQVLGEEEIVAAAAYALCSRSEDRFNKPKGRKKALGRLMDAWLGAKPHKFVKIYTP